MPDLTLHGYWRSSAAWRVRIALALKGLPYATVAHDLRTGAQAAAAYRACNPQGLVPALDTGEGQEAPLTQSLAIIEWLEETQAQPALLPADPLGRARVRAMAQVIACDVHPLGNLRVLKALRGDLGADEAQVAAWLARWMGDGFAALETMVAQWGGAFAFGDAPGLADCCLVPQIYAARRFGVGLGAYPRLVAIDARCAGLAAFAMAHPAAQADADPS
ncbi:MULTISPECIES: maleylacetoacetate isomerase [unclassified Sphingomonas]|uniref:maleylacetoacetate isomerase n=1 Tax=Novosphingobium rhizosphaerae TaxID=1551649 RepID=UPI0015CEC911